MAGRGSKKGERRGGRQKGTPNVVSRTVREALVEALNDGKGASAFFLKMKNARSRVERIAFANLCGKLIPTEITGKDGTPFMPSEPIEPMAALARRIAFVLEKGKREIEQDQTEGGK